MHIWSSPLIACNADQGRKGRSSTSFRHANQIGTAWVRYVDVQNVRTAGRWVRIRDTVSACCQAKPIKRPPSNASGQVACGSRDSYSYLYIYVVYKHPYMVVLICAHPYLSLSLSLSLSNSHCTRVHGFDFGTNHPGFDFSDAPCSPSLAGPHSCKPWLGSFSIHGTG